MRKTSHFLPVTVCALAFAGVSLAVVVKLWVNGQSASSVLGQTDFVTATSGAGNNKVSLPSAVAIDPSTGKVFVAEWGNNRILRFASAAAVTTGAAAEAVIGQPDFVTNTCVVAQDRLCAPTQMSFDPAGRLWVAQQGGTRVTRYDNPSTVASGVASAAQVLGQPNFTTSASGCTATTMTAVTGVFADASGRVWVGDQVNNRVLRFDNAAAKPNGAAADGVLGQPNFTTCTSTTTATGMASVRGVTGTPSGTLFVSDYGNNRILKFNNAAAKPNGGAADGVLGQADFVSNLGGTSSNKFSIPHGITLDAIGRLFVSDYGNNRVLVFYKAITLPNGAPADAVLGQPDFATNTTGVTAAKMNQPWLIAVNPANLDEIYVPDRNNNRVLRFVAAGTPTAAGVTVSGRVVNSSGYAVRGATVSFVASDGTRYTAIANSFGYYSLSNVPSGETYMANVSSRGLVFVPRAVTVTDQLTGVDFVAQ